MIKNKQRHSGMAEFIDPKRKNKARGFKTFQNFMAVIYLVAGNLDFTKVNAHYEPLP